LRVQGSPSLACSLALGLVLHHCSDSGASDKALAFDLMEAPVRRVEAHWEFHCPECGAGHFELGRMAKDQELVCEICEHEDGRVVTLQRWLSAPVDQARLRVGLVA
jgi:hypothetical protein